MAETSDTRASC